MIREPHPERPEAPLGAVNKPVAALAIVPLNRSLTVTARKAYNVMLHIAQSQGAGEEAFSAPLTAILRGFGADSWAAGEAKRYIDQMMSTKIEWRPLGRGGQWDADGLPDDTVTDELRVFNMLAEVRLYKKNGENWVTWFYPPTIREQMLGPERWARLELRTIARLGTYTAVALYEICARYRDNPGGATVRQHWSWWVAVLKGSELARQREWRKFKNEFVNPAVREINEVSDLEIELVEFRDGRAVAEVQFTVRRKPGAPAESTQPVDVALVTRALSLGVREHDADALVERYGEAAFARALDALQRQAAGAGARPIVNKTAYLKAILAGMDNQALPAAVPPAATAQDTATPTAAAGNGAAVAAQARALAAARQDFEALPEAEQAAWRVRLHEHALAGGASPTLLRRLEVQQWQSPLVMASLLRFFMAQRGKEGT